jgi:hypothetical protein
MSVLLRASTGTVVSSPCNRAAAMTWACNRWNSGIRMAVQAPTWSANVDRLSGTPSRL